MSKYDFTLTNPIMNAAGSLGFVPDARGPVELERLGVFVTNPLSMGSRTPAHGQRYLPYPGGFLLHTGFPNPGFKAARRRYTARWARSPIPVIVHILAQGTDDVTHMVEHLERLEGVMGVELGLPPDVDMETAYAMTEAALGEFPVIVRLPLEGAVELAETVTAAGADSVSLGPPRGVLPTQDGELVRGRLYGQAVFPHALATVREIAHRGVPVIGAGGVYTPRDVEMMIMAGAMAVQLDAILWRGGFEDILTTEWTSGSPET
jgi:dihydroorotate dehydrogenase (NAD+) catalytic subunit